MWARAPGEPAPPWTRAWRRWATAWIRHELRAAWGDAVTAAPVPDPAGSPQPRSAHAAVPLTLVVIGALVIAGAFVLRSQELVSTRTTETTDTRPLEPLPAGVEPSAPTRATKEATTKAPPSDALVALVLAVGAALALVGAFYPRIAKGLKELSVTTPLGGATFVLAPQASPSSGPVGTTPSEPAPEPGETPPSLEKLLAQPPLAHLHLVDAQARLRGVREARVALLGFGLDPEMQQQPAFGGRVEPPRSVHEDGQHGTLAAAQLGFVAALARSARILAVGILDAYGSGQTSDVLKGLDVAREWQPDIVLLDFGAPVGADEGPWQIARPLLERIASEALLIAPAGNVESQRPGGASPSYAPVWPALEPSVLGIAATSAPRRLWEQSARGVELAAPGLRLLALEGVADGRFVEELRSGTSLAAGVVTAVAALACSADASLDPQGLRRLLVQTGGAIEGHADIAALDVDAIVAAIAG